MTWAILVLLVGRGGATPIEEAERAATEAVRLSTEQPAEAVEQARKALDLTADFEPTAFVKPGRKGEVVEDAYLAAREEYRRHRARLYGAVGECSARAGRHEAAARYLRRANDLDPRGSSRLALARSLLALGRGREALDVLLAGGAPALGPESLGVASEAADALGLPSLQAEIDRARLLALGVTPRVESRDGPLRLPTRAHLSTGQPFRLEEEALALLHVAEPTCRSCSADLTSLQRVVPAGVRLVMAPMAPEDDRILRQTLELYRLSWPLLLGHGAGGVLGVPAPAVLVVARRGWVGAVARPPFGETLPPVLALLARTDVRESVPRAAWNRVPVERRSPRSRPGLLHEGLAPGEEEPAPEGFERAVGAYRAGRFGEALQLFETLEQGGDGWLLPPEARLNRALCLAGLGQREKARRLLLRTGDSRFQDAVDRALERVGTPRE